MSKEDELIINSLYHMEKDQRSITSVNVFLSDEDQKPTGTSLIK